MQILEWNNISGVFMQKNKKQYPNESGDFDNTFTS